MNAPIMAKVGEYYQVPCLHIPYGFCGSSWVPVIDPKHVDAELKFQHPHFHIDWRFATWQVFESYYYSRGQVLSSDQATYLSKPKITGEPRFLRRKCRREMPTFPSASELEHKSSAPTWIAFEQSKITACAKLINGHTCPHRGIDLRPFEKPDGTAICPGHGLKFNMRTGEIMPHHTQGLNP